jgi:hypothetical protein
LPLERAIEAAKRAREKALGGFRRRTEPGRDLGVRKALTGAEDKHLALDRAELRDGPLKAPKLCRRTISRHWEVSWQILGTGWERRGLRAAMRSGALAGCNRRRIVGSVCMSRWTIPAAAFD